MKKIIFAGLCCLLSLITKGQNYTVKGSQNCGGFTVQSITNDKTLGKKAFIYGTVGHCLDRDTAYFSVLVLFDEYNKKIDTIRADRQGRYKKLIIPGTYKVWAGEISYGSVETNLTDFNAQTANELDLYLATDPPIKD